VEKNTSKLKTIAIDKETHEMIMNLSKLNDQNHGQLVKAMAKYFSKFGVDPNVPPSNVAKEVKNLDKRFISFIRKQEEMHLIPLSNQMELLKKEAQKIVQILEKPKSVSTDPNEKVELTKHVFNLYLKMLHNVYQTGLKLNMIVKKEKISIPEVVDFSEKLLKMQINAGN
jgi:hypothetical protein